MSDTLNALRRETLCNGFGTEYPRDRGCMVSQPCVCLRQAVLMDALDREMAKMLKAIEQIDGGDEPRQLRNAQGSHKEKP